MGSIHMCFDAEVPDEWLTWAKYLAIDPAGGVFVFQFPPEYDSKSGWIPGETDGWFERVGFISREMLPENVKERVWELTDGDI